MCRVREFDPRLCVWRVFQRLRDLDQLVSDVMHTLVLAQSRRLRLFGIVVQHTEVLHVDQQRRRLVLYHARNPQQECALQMECNTDLHDKFAVSCNVPYSSNSHT